MFKKTLFDILNALEYNIRPNIVAIVYTVTCKQHMAVNVTMYQQESNAKNDCQ